MAIKQETETVQTSARGDLSLDFTRGGGASRSLFGLSVCGCGKVVPVIVELLRHIPSLSSKYPQAFLGLITKVDGIYPLSFVGDRAFFVRILSLVSGAVFRFFGEYLLID